VKTFDKEFNILVYNLILSEYQYLSAA